MKLPTLKRLGLRNLGSDHFETLVSRNRDGISIRNLSDLSIFLVLPLFAGALTYFLGGHLKAPSEMIAGVVIMTGLLFGVLTHVLSLGVKLIREYKYPKTDRIVLLTSGLRANVSWAIAVGLLLNTLLVVMGSFWGDKSGTDETGYPSWISAIIIVIFTHLMLTLLMILNRVRSTYKILTSDS